MSGQQNARSRFDARRLLARLRDPNDSLATMAALAGFGFVATLLMHYTLAPHIAHLAIWDTWYESDPARVFEVATARTSYVHYTTNHHPLFSIIIYPPVFVLKTLGLDPGLAVALVLASVAAAWISAFHYVVSGFGFGRLQAMLVTLLAAGSAGVMFWFPVPETFSFGALSIIGVIALSVWAEKLEGRTLFLACVAAGVISLSVTTTNWSAGLGMALVFLGIRKAILAGFCSLAITIVLWGVQSLIFPAATSFFDVFTSAQTGFLFNPDSLGVGAKLIAVFFHSVVAPPPSALADATRLSLQALWPGQGSLLSLLAVGLWTIMLGLGAWKSLSLAGLASPFKMRRTLRVILLATLAQIMISVAFGVETFLYSAHFAPLLVLIGAMSLLSPIKPYGLPLIALVFATTTVNNLIQFQASDQFIEDVYERERAFARTMEALTQPSDLTICAINPIRIGAPPETPEPPRILNSPMFPTACFHNFDGVHQQRMGWIIWYEQWSVEAVETAIARGARYFASPYAYGLRNQDDFVGELTARYRTIEQTPDWIILDLETAAEE